METQELLLPPKRELLTAKELIPVNFLQIENLSDSTGIMQHALYDMPNRKEGYCIDDNSRALLLMVWAIQQENNEIARRLLPVYLGFIHYMQREDGAFRNFMCYDRACPEDVGSEDAFGRTLMALGFLVKENTNPSYVKAGKEIFEKAYPNCEKLTSLRGMANSIIGLNKFVQFNQPDDNRKNTLIVLANRIARMYEENKTADWHWFEPILAYDNAIMPLALLHAYELTSNEKYLQIALESFAFLESKVFHRGILRPVGNKGWCVPGSKPAQFDQQGIDAMAMVLYYQQAWKMTRDKKIIRKLLSSYQWFLGANDLGVSLYDQLTGGSADGLQEEGINYNMGAESTLAFWLSHFAAADVLRS